MWYERLKEICGEEVVVHASDPVFSITGFLSYSEHSRKFTVNGTDYISFPAAYVDDIGLGLGIRKVIHLTLR